MCCNITYVEDLHNFVGTFKLLTSSQNYTPDLHQDHPDSELRAIITCKHGGPSILLWTTQLIYWKEQIFGRQKSEISLPRLMYFCKMNALWSSFTVQSSVSIHPLGGVQRIGEIYMHCNNPIYLFRKHTF